MRLHRLEVTAFGPFADTASVDFDDLSSAGLFLLTGPTGAGKSSILDAVCFALYGDVPGDRGGAKRLRSDQAAPGVEPRVELELSLAGRRFRIVRSPTWERAKLRGTGTIRQQPSAVVAELVGSQWVPLATRLDEAGQLLGGLLGMNLSQFTQVALLPQGRFMAFLRATSDERHRLLQRLFRTGRFEVTERWLVERRRVLAGVCETHHQVAADLASRVSEVDGAPLPDRWDVHELTPAADDGSLRWWSEGVAARAERRRRDAVTAHDVATAAESAARADLDVAREVAALRARWDAARVELARLDGDDAAHVERTHRLATARRAAGVEPVRRLARASAQTVDTTHEEVSRQSRLTGLAPDTDAVAGAWQNATEQAALARSLMPTAERRDRIRTRLPSMLVDIEALSTRVDALREEREELPARVGQARADLDVERDRAAGLPAAREAVAGLTRAAACLVDVRSLEVRLATAREALVESRGVALTCHEQWLEVREARLDGMAAELAGALAVGACCPVCGSADHPLRAIASIGSPDAASERAARASLDDAKALEHLRDEEVRDLTTSLAAARARAGDDPETLASRLAAARERLAVLEPAVGEVARLSAVLARDEGRLAELADRHATRASELAALRATADAAAAEAGALDAELTAALADVPAELGGATPADLVRDAGRRREQADRMRSALDDHEQAMATARDAAAAAAAAALEAGFASSDEAGRAALPEPEMTALAARVEQHERALAAARAVLGEPGADAARLTPTPDLDALAALHRDAARELTQRSAAASRATTCAERLRELVAELDQALTAWSPQRVELRLTAGLAAFVEGKSSDNRWRMRLSAYVLAYRLGQVVDAANLRLLRMSDQRYALEHTGARGVGETRGGLSLLVRDDWSGERRDPATLSGGETFVVSLALALGLADVISAEAGGVELDTLFVDEGFGSLDADTLDDVMDTLDGLRDGGRVVGVVSHVAEMRDRIPTQLTLTKSRGGSRVTIVR